MTELITEFQIHKKKTFTMCILLCLAGNAGGITVRKLYHSD